MKQHLKVREFFGTSERAVQNQIYIRLIAYLLLFLMRMESGTQRTMLELQRILSEVIWAPWRALWEALNRKPQRSSKGRQAKRE